MSKEKQIEEMAKALNEATFGVNTHTLADHLKPETINKVAEYLYNAGYRKQEWISVEDRLPEEDTIVLVWCGEVSVYNYLQNDLWYTGYCDITTSESGVTHWMPLPEAPKGGVE